MSILTLFGSYAFGASAALVTVAAPTATLSATVTLVDFRASCEIACINPTATLTPPAATLRPTAAILTATAPSSSLAANRTFYPGDAALLHEDSDTLVSEIADRLVDENAGEPATIVLTAPEAIHYVPSTGYGYWPKVTWSGLTSRYWVRQWGPVGRTPVNYTTYATLPVPTITVEAGDAWMVVLTSTTLTFSPDAAEIAVSAPTAEADTLWAPVRWGGLTSRYWVRTWGPVSSVVAAASGTLSVSAGTLTLEAPTATLGSRALWIAEAYLDLPDPGASGTPRGLLWFSPLSTEWDATRWGPIAGVFDTGMRAWVAETYLEVPDRVHSALVAEASLQLPDVARSTWIAEVYLEVPSRFQVDEGAWIVTQAPTATASKPRLRVVPSAGAITVTAPTANLSFGTFAPVAAAITVEAPTARLVGGSRSETVTAQTLTLTAPTAFGFSGVARIAEASLEVPSPDRTAQLSKAWFVVPTWDYVAVSRSWLTLPDAPHVGDRIFGHRTGTVARTTLTDEDTDG